MFVLQQTHTIYVVSLVVIGVNLFLSASAQSLIKS